MSDMAYATGAHPDYNPQMAESITVRTFHWVGFAAQEDLLLDINRVWEIRWVDTDGAKHGRLFEYGDLALKHLLIAEDGKEYPLGCASTQAGCVWVWITSDHRAYAELQQLGDRSRWPQIPVVDIGDPPKASEDLLWSRVSCDVNPVVWVGEGRC